MPRPTPILLLITILLVTCAPTPRAQAPQHTRTTATIQQDRQTTARQITQTTDRLNQTDRQITQQLNRLTTLDADIRNSATHLATLNANIDTLRRNINATGDTIRTLNDNLHTQRRAYITTLRTLQPHIRNINPLTYILASNTLTQTLSRIRYLKRLTQWRTQKAARINATIDRLHHHRTTLTTLRHNQNLALTAATAQQQTLTQQQNQSRQLITQLRRQQTQLQATLTRQKQRAAALDRELDRLITAEQNRLRRSRQQTQQKQPQTPQKQPRPTKKTDPAPQQPTPTTPTDPTDPTATFQAAKGHHPYPVPPGTYKIISHFGRNPHPTLPGIETDNAGIDLLVTPGTQARAIHPGTVSYVIRQDGFGNIVMLRHGRYLTIYAGLSNVLVRQGQQITLSQPLGTIAPTPTDPRPILHFELRDERTKLNPLNWLR